VATFPVTVHEVVVDEGEVVHQLYRHATGHSYFGGGPGRLGGQHGQRRTDPFASSHLGGPPVDFGPPEVVADHVPDARHQAVHGLSHPGLGGVARPVEHLGHGCCGCHKTSLFLIMASLSCDRGFLVP
jgi:hypothetical protein